MHLYGFDLRDPVFHVGPWQLSFQLVTLENVYGLDPARTQVREEKDGSWMLNCFGLSYAGQQQHIPGVVQVIVQPQPGSSHRLQVSIVADARHKIRAVKILVRGLPYLTLLDLLDQEPATPTEQIIRRYPNDAAHPARLRAHGGRRNHRRAL